MSSHHVPDEPEAGVADVLEAIADTVLQMVLFQNLTNLDVEPLLASIRWLVDLARKKAEKWTRTEDAANQKHMLQACATMAEATELIDSSLTVLRKSPFDAKAKDDLLWSARSVVQCTVTLLQLSDNYDIRKILEGCTNAQKEQDELLALADLSQLQENIRRFVFETVNLAKLVQARINYIVDPVLQEDFARWNAIVRENSEPLIHAFVACAQAPDDAEAADRRDTLAEELSAAYEEIAALASESTQEMFAGIDLDLNPLDGDDPNRRVKASVEALPELIGQLQDAAKAGPRQAAKAATPVQEAVMQQLRAVQDAARAELDPNKKRMLEQAAKNLASNLRNMLDGLRDYAKDPSPENKGKLIELSNAVLDASNALREVEEMPDHLDNAAQCVQLALSHLADAAKYAKPEQVQKALKGAERALANQADDAQAKVAQDPARKKALNEAVGGMAGIMKGLLDGTDGCLDARDGDPGLRRKRWDEFEAALEDAGAYSDRIADLANPERVAELALTDPADRLQAQVNAVNADADAMAGLEAQDMGAALKRIADGLTTEMGLAKRVNVAPQAEDAVRCLEPLKAAARANDPDAMDDAVHGLKDAQLKVVMEVVDPLEQVIDSVGSLKSHRAQLMDALEAGNARAARNACRDIQRDLQQQVQALERMPADGATEDALRKLAIRQGEIADQLPDLVETALLSKAAPQDMDVIRGVLDEAERNAEEIVTHCASDVEAMCVQNAARCNATLRRLQGAVNAGNADAAAGPLLDAERQVHKQALLAGLLGARSGDAELKKTLLQAGEDLADVLAQLADATHHAIDSYDPAALDALIRQARDANAAIVGGTSSPEDRMEALGANINRLIDSIHFSVDGGAQPALLGVVEGLEQQCLLADVVGQHYPERKAALDRAADRARHVVDQLRPAIVAVMEDPSKPGPQRKLEELVKTQARQANNNLVQASQPELLDRLIANGEALDRDREALEAALKAGDRANARHLAVAVGDRLQKQGTLAQALSFDVPHDETARELEETGMDIENLGNHWHDTALARVDGTGPVTNTAKFNRNMNQAKKLNAAILTAARRVKAGDFGDAEAAGAGDGDDEWAGTDNQLRMAANKVRQATRELVVDDTPTGIMFGYAQQIGAVMQELAAAAAAGDKAAIIKTAREVARLVNEVVKVAKKIETGDPAVKNEIVSYAVGAKNFAVQLKILAAVKASIDERDRTAENQLVSCAQGISNDIASAVKCALVAELKH